MSGWIWVIIAVFSGILIGLVIVPRVWRVIRDAPPPDLPEHLAPGWYVRCTRCGRTRTLASVGGIRIGGNQNALKATLGWCRGCRGLRVIRVVHKSRLSSPGE